MNSKIKKQLLQNSYELQQETQQAKKFVQDTFQINYLNTSKIYYQLSNSSSDVKINNYLCYQQGNILYKVTEILYEDKLIRIEDQFEVNLDPTYMSSSYYMTEKKNDKNQVKCSRNIQKVRLFNKSSNNVVKGQKKDKKNIVKNIIKLFNCWLQKRQDSKSEYHQEAFTELKNILQKQNFNNRLIKKIITNKLVRKAFLEFIQENAQEEIKYSRIQDKESHYEAIRIYKKLMLENLQNENQSHSPNMSADSGQIYSSEMDEQNMQGPKQKKIQNIVNTENSNNIFIPFPNKCKEQQKKSHQLNHIFQDKN